ncbi:tail tube [Rhizobium phage RL2RES]|uniref:Tail tube protein n=1 Tax=Rhizobium phage RL2RES TaxID=103371 RepID=A0A6B9JDA0_9CAUD|nr:tail tube [Rhizobium phage RL2RES]QGZ14166.1 tail tube protein [Rhizobium phage RL2RES]
MAESFFTNFNAQAFQSQLGNVAQLNNFAASITLPSGIVSLIPNGDQFARKVSFAIRAAEKPEMSIGEISVPFRGGSRFRIPGDRDYTATWNVTCRFDIKNTIYNAFEGWNDAIVGNVDSDTAFADDDISQVMGVGELFQLSRNGRIIKAWSIANIWPSVVGSISYDWSAENTIVEVPVTFVMSHMESEVTRNNVISEQDLLSGTVIF